MRKEKAIRNKTLDITVEEGREYLQNCLTAGDNLSLKENIINKTICGDTFQILPLLPRNFVDLLIVDPPYNLNKDYDGKKFCAISDEEYEEYTTKWIEMIKPLLKNTASVYVCCDWKSSLIIGNVLKKYLRIPAPR